MNRITIKDLKRLADQLNEITGSPTTCYVRTAEGACIPQAGHFHISQAYGGYCLHRMSMTPGCTGVTTPGCTGVTTPLSGGHGPARQLFNEMLAYKSALFDAKEADQTTAALKQRIAELEAALKAATGQ